MRQAIADAGLALDRDARHDEVSDVTVDRPQRDFDLPRELSRLHDVAPAEELADLE